MKTIEFVSMALFLAGETLSTPAGHKLSFCGYDATNKVYELLIVRDGAARVEGWKSVAQTFARAEAMMGRVS